MNVIDASQSNLHALSRLTNNIPARNAILFVFWRKIIILMFMQTFIFLSERTWLHDTRQLLPKKCARWRYVSLKKPGHKWRRRRGESDLNFKCCAFFRMIPLLWNENDITRLTMPEDEEEGETSFVYKINIWIHVPTFFSVAGVVFAPLLHIFSEARSRSGNNRSIFGWMIRGCKWCMGTWDIWVDVFSLSVCDAIRCVFKIHRGGISKLMPFV